MFLSPDRLNRDLQPPMPPACLLLLCRGGAESQQPPRSKIRSQCLPQARIPGPICGLRRIGSEPPDWPAPVLPAPRAARRFHTRAVLDRSSCRNDLYSPVPCFPSNAVSFSLRICLARNSRERTEASLAFKISAISHGDSSSTVESLIASRKGSGSAAISDSKTAAI